MLGGGVLGRGGFLDWSRGLLLCGWFAAGFYHLDRF